MRILIDIGHPAHVHYFREMAKILSARGHDLLFTARDKEMTIDLLKLYNLHYIIIGKPFKSKVGKIFGLIYFTMKLLVVGLKYKADIYLNATHYSAIVAFILRKPHIALEDTFNMEQVMLYLPFTSVILTGDYNHPLLGMKEINYSGYQELAYLHPNRFQLKKEILKELNVAENEKYVIVRFVSWNASHDFGHQGMSLEQKKKLVSLLKKYGKVFITSERKLPEELEPYRIRISPDKIHHAIAFAALLYGESATMASEAAVLGTPSIFIDSTGRYYTTDIENRYNLVFNFSEDFQAQEKSIKKAIEILGQDDYIWKKRRDDLLRDKIDVTALLIWFVENYPRSAKIMKENPDYQYRFR